MWGRGTVLGERYTLTDRIGGGGMGDVWRADDQVLERQVAVKVLHPALLEDETFAERFRREARLLAALNHPGIVDIHDYGESADGTGGQVAYIVMELIDGRPLHQVLAESGPMNPGRALALVAQVLDALHAAHQREIVHRDLKPANLMLRDGDQMTVTDFGIARATTSTKITASHAMLGTALYMAPEQAEGTSTTPASDLYAVGVVCFELLTGQLPFTGETVVEIVLKHIREPAPPLPGLFPEAVRGFVATALAKRPEDRFADAAAMAAAARAAMVSGGPATLPATAPAPVVAGTVEIVVVATADEPKTLVQDRSRRNWRGIMVPIVIPIVITVGTSSVLLVDWRPWQTDPSAGGRPSVVASSDTGSTGTSLSPSPSPSAESSPSAAGSSAAASPPVPDPNAVPGTENQPPGTVPNTGGGTTTGGGSTGGTTTTGGGKATTPGGTTTTVTAPAPNNPAPTTSAPNNPAPATTKPAPTSTAPADPPVPQGCGGAGWGDITNAGSGRKLGLAAGSPTAGAGVVSGGTTSYGWVRSARDPGGWYNFHPCSLSRPRMLIEINFQSSEPKVLLDPGSSFAGPWAVYPASSGAVNLRDHGGGKCMTDNGVGKQVTMQECTPGNRHQEWYIPAAP